MIITRIPILLAISIIVAGQGSDRVDITSALKGQASCVRGQIINAAGDANCMVLMRKAECVCKPGIYKNVSSVVDFICTTVENAASSATQALSTYCSLNGISGGESTSTSGSLTSTTYDLSTQDSTTTASATSRSTISTTQRPSPGSSDSSVSVPSTRETTPAPLPIESGSGNPNNKQGLSNEAIIGIVVGVAGFLATLFLAFLEVRRRRNNRTGNRQAHDGHRIDQRYATMVNNTNNFIVPHASRNTRPSSGTGNMNGQNVNGGMVLRDA